MGRQFRIRVYGAQRHNIDPALLAQVVILLGRQLTAAMSTTPPPRARPTRNRVKILQCRAWGKPWPG